MWLNEDILDCSRQHGLVVELLLLLAQDLQLEELLLLLQEAGVGRVHRHFIELLFLVWRNVLMVLQLFHPRFGLLALLAAAFIARYLGQALLRSTTKEKRKGGM